MKFVAGIDGGGTKTKLMCYEIGNDNVTEKLFGAFNLNGIGEEKFRALLSEIGEYLNCLGQCEAMCIGSAGISNQKMVDMVAEAMAAAGITNWKLLGDQVIALAGALDGEPGISMVSGTGSICFGRNADGKEARSGGWGHLIGDEGSAYGLGRDALGAVAGAWDGVSRKTLLSEFFALEMGLDTQRKIISYVYGGDKSRVAELAKLVEKAAAQGDASAIEIIEKHAKLASLNIGSVLKQLGLKKAKVAMLGGLLEHDTMFKAAFIKAVEGDFPGCKCVEPMHDAAAGALMLAKRQ